MTMSEKYYRAFEILKTIAASGGKVTDDGIVCDGEWCAEQAQEFFRVIGGGS